MIVCNATKCKNNSAGICKFESGKFEVVYANDEQITLVCRTETMKEPSMGLSSQTWWLELKQQVTCPKCNQLTHLMIKRGTKTVLYGDHTLPNTSGFINPMFYQIRIVYCDMSRKPFDSLNDFKQLAKLKKQRKVKRRNE
jgi:uncharacterized protein (DUF2225 family)